MTYHFRRRSLLISAALVAAAVLLGSCSGAPPSAHHGATTTSPAEVLPVASVIAHGLAGLLPPAGSVPKTLVADPSYGSSSGAVYNLQAERGATAVGCSTGAGEAFVDRGYVDGDGSKEAASKHQIVLAYVLDCPKKRPAAVLAQYEKAATNPNLTVTPVGGIGQGAISELLKATGTSARSGSYVWYDGNYLLSLTYAGTLPTFSMQWLSLQAFNLQTRDFGHT